MTDIGSWLLAIYAEQARHCCVSGETLRDLAVKKAIVEQCIAFLTWGDNNELMAVDLAQDVLKHLASAHADRPGYQKEWAVGT